MKPQTDVLLNEIECIYSLQICDLAKWADLSSD